MTKGKWAKKAAKKRIPAYSMQCPEADQAMGVLARDLVATSPAAYENFFIKKNTVIKSCAYDECTGTSDDTKLKKCSKCRVVAYCCKSCQLADWKEHKLECTFLTSTRAAGSESSSPSQE